MEVERKSMEDTEKGTPDGETNITSETLDSMLQKFENGDAPDAERKDAVNEEQDLPAEESASCLDKVEVDQTEMAEQEEDSSGRERSIDSDTLDSTVGKIKQVPAAQSAQKVEKMSRDARLFGREKSVYELLGSGRVAHVLLWRNAMLSAGILTSITTVYVVFEWLGWHVLSVFSRLLIIALAVLFVWSNMASLLKKSPPHIPISEVSEKKALHVAHVLRDQINLSMDVLRDVLLGKDLKLFLKIEFALWILSLLGKSADSLTLIYLGALFLLTVPWLYERHEDKVDHTLKRGYEHTQRFSGKLREQVLAKMPVMASTQHRKSL